VAANVLLNTSLLGGLMGYNQAWVRYSYNGASAGMMPRRYESTTARGVHRPLTFLQAACGLVAIGLTAWRNWDPFQILFFRGGTIGGYGVLWLIAFAGLSVVVYFWRDNKGESVWVAKIFPFTSAAMLLTMAGLASWHFAVMLGVADSDPMATAFPLGYLVVALAGLSWSLKLRRVAPAKYVALAGPPEPEVLAPAKPVAQEAR
jgi:hypothetical protein